MLFAFARRAALGAVLSGAAACADSSAVSASSPEIAGTVMVSFDGAAVLTARPSESRDVGIRVTGPDTAVSVTLEGDYADASLSADEVTTASGRSAVTLRAPSAPATFSLRAHVRDV